MLDSSYAYFFTLTFLRTYTTAYRRQRTGLANGIISQLHITVNNTFNKIGYLNLYRTSCHTRCMFTLQASLRFFQRHFVGISILHFFKICAANNGILRRHWCFFRFHIRHCQHPQISGIYILLPLLFLVFCK